MIRSATNVSTPAKRSRYARSRRRAFSLIDMLLALAISGAALAATFQALHVSFLNYQNITDSASSHVVSRIMMHRILALIRTGTDFGPFPADVLLNPEIEADFIEFVSRRDDAGAPAQIMRIEYRDDPDQPVGQLWLVLIDPTGATANQEQMMLDSVEAAQFRMTFDVGPRLVRCTVDLSILPDDTIERGVDSNNDGVIDESDVNEAIDLYEEAGALRRVRLVASASPRQD
jgi:hypothetical protein